MTTDLQTGEMFVPDKGNLLKAVRASMSIPGVFPPVYWDGRILVDGYLARNLPVDVARAMGADIVIQPDLTGISSQEFKRVAETIEPGRRAPRGVKTRSMSPWEP